MNYTLVAYKPSSDDYCRGCHMATYYSDFKLTQATIPDEIIHAAAQLLTENQFMDTNEAGFELTLLEDGVESDTDNLLGAAHVKAEAMIKERQEREQQEKEAATQRTALAAQAREREQYEKLKAKYA